MIFVVEPICKNMSHEKVNSGFISGIRNAFPEEIIRIYAHESHICALNRIFAIDGTNLNSLEFVPTKFADASTFFGFVKSIFFFRSILANARLNGTNRLFFLSFNPQFLFVLKLLSLKFRFANFALVLHASFESLAAPIRFNLALEQENLPTKSLSEKIKSNNIYYLPMLALHALRRKFAFSGPWKFFVQKVFTDRRLMYWMPSPRFRFIALGPHVAKNASSLIGEMPFEIVSITLPTVFSKMPTVSLGEPVKFAVFGYGNSLVLHNVLLKLRERANEINRGYEIKVISMDSRGTDGFQYVTKAETSGPLDRKHMEKMAEDVNFFLLFYSENQYRLSCSGAILEALSYSKPILHFNNDCINAFNKSDSPIGYCNKTVDEFVNRMISIINSPLEFAKDFEIFKKNIRILRSVHSIEGSLGKIRNSLSFKEI